MQPIAAWAEGLARHLLADSLPRRWSHVQGVAAQARTLKPSLGTDAELLEAAAWLHDIGYIPELAATGLHGLDGARYLRDVQHAEPLLCRLGRAPLLCRYRGRRTRPRPRHDPRVRPASATRGRRAGLLRPPAPTASTSR